MPSQSPSVVLSRGAGYLAFFAALLAIGLARLIDLDHLVVQHDEVFTLVRAFGYSGVEVQSTLFSGRLLTPAEVLVLQTPTAGHGWDAAWAAFVSHPEHAPLYYALARAAALALAPLGVDPVSATRAVAALAGLLIIPATFLLARLLFGRGAVPWVAALLVAVSPMLFLYAQEARQYALWVLMVALSGAALVWAAREPGRTGRWWLYGVTLAVGLYTHLLFVLMLPVHGLYVLLARRAGEAASTLRRWLIAAAAATLAFGPWIAVVLMHHEAAANNTEWMARAIGWQRNLGEWAVHATRIFVDLAPGAPGHWSVLLAPLGLAALWFLWQAPRPAAWLVGGTVAVYVGVVLGPDLILGGSRSQHVRYAIPAALAVILMIAWVLGQGLESPRRLLRLASAGTIGALALLGLASMLAIARADAWWSKQFSTPSAELARVLNAAERPLVVASPSGVSAGELLSLAHRLDDHVRIWGESPGTAPDATRFDPILALMPSPGLAQRLAPGTRLDPVPGTWQWFWARPEATDTPPAAADGPRP